MLLSPLDHDHPALTPTAETTESESENETKRNSHHGAVFEGRSYSEQRRKRRNATIAACDSKKIGVDSDSEREKL